MKERKKTAHLNAATASYHVHDIYKPQVMAIMSLITDSLVLITEASMCEQFAQSQWPVNWYPVHSANKKRLVLTFHDIKVSLVS